MGPDLNDRSLLFQSAVREPRTFFQYTKLKLRPILPRLSILRRPITTPEVNAMIKPVETYRSAVFHPKSPRNRSTATSLIIGADTRKEKVTPSGTPVSTKPMKRGTSEQEQKGVTIPSNAAGKPLVPSQDSSGSFGEKYVRMMPIPKTTRRRSIMTLGASKRKNRSVSVRRRPDDNPKTSKTTTSAIDCSERYSAIHKTKKRLEKESSGSAPHETSPPEQLPEP